MQPPFRLVYGKQIRFHQYQQRFMELWFYLLIKNNRRICWEKTRTHLTYHFSPRPYPLLPLPSTLHCWTHFSNNPIFPSSVFKYSASKSPKVTECVRQRSKVKTLLLKRFALRKFHVIDDQNTREDMTSDRRSEPAWSQISFEACNSNLVPRAFPLKKGWGARRSPGDEVDAIPS